MEGGAGLPGLPGERAAASACSSSAVQHSHLPPNTLYMPHCAVERFDLWRDAADAQSVHFRVVCSKGTYIRSLAHDLGHAVGSAAHLTALRREAIGEYEVEGAWGIQELADGLHQQRLERKQEQNAAEAAGAAAAGEQPAAAEGGAQ